MNRRLRVHRVQKRDVVDTLSKVREQIGHVLATLTVLLEVPLGSDNPTLVAMPTSAKGLHFDGFPIQGIKVGLVVERVDMARAAIHEEKNHRFRFARELGRTGRQR